MRTLLFSVLPLAFLLQTPTSQAETPMITAVSTIQSLTFRARGRELKVLGMEEIRKSLHPQSVAVFEPHEGKVVTYLAVPAQAVFEKIYGKEWTVAEEVLFTCSDGYQPSIPVKYFLDSKAYFAIAREGQPHFTLRNKDQNEALVGLAPFYLVWDNQKDRTVKLRGSSIWPYKVVGVDLVRFKDRFPKMSPAPEAISKVNAGFLHFRNYCMSCHSINGEGGKKARDLNYPKNITELRGDRWLYRFLEDPNRMQPGIKMAPFNKLEPHRPRAIRETVAYLEHMKGRKVKPEEASSAEGK